MKNNLVLTLAAAVMLLVSCNKMETTESGVQYKIHTHDESARAVAEGDILLMNLRISTATSDSVILETYADNSPRYIPANEPVLTEALLMLAKGDSAEMIVNADSLFKKSFGSEKPAGMANETHVRFVVTVVDVFNQAEMQQKQMQQMGDFMMKDSIASEQYLSTLQNVQTTASGLKYIVVKKTSGKAVAKGNKVSMLYRGTLLNGQEFDSNMDGAAPPFEFSVGLGQVIPGWDEAVSMMHEGEEFKFIIPWKLAYGERGAGPIPPFSTLVFDVKLVKIN